MARHPGLQQAAAVERAVSSVASAVPPHPPTQADLPLPDALRPDAVPHTKMYHINLSGALWWGEGLVGIIAMALALVGRWVRLRHSPAHGSLRLPSACGKAAVHALIHPAPTLTHPALPLPCSVPLRGRLLGHPAAVPHRAHPPVREGGAWRLVVAAGAAVGVVYLHGSPASWQCCL